ncbi:DUF1918 domain-containing protein [Nocardia sp. NPDC051321]|uniref:DUF1918 domain-containing protein n=1 Tax=Nocardia sp. NPDC051321 TaxID=3364323 RepID=UPI0037B9DC94
MYATIGDQIFLRDSSSASPRDRSGEIIEVRGPDGQPPYLVRFADGRESLVDPGPDTIVEPPGSAE